MPRHRHTGESRYPVPGPLDSTHAGVSDRHHFHTLVCRSQPGMGGSRERGRRLRRGRPNCVGVGLPAQMSLWSRSALRSALTSTNARAIILPMRNPPLASAPYGAAAVSARDPVSILLKPALPASIRGSRAFQNPPKCPSLQIRKGAEWNTLKQLLGRALAPTGSPAPNRCGCRGVIPLQAMQVTFTVATQVDA